MSRICLPYYFYVLFQSGGMERTTYLLSQYVKELNLSRPLPRRGGMKLCDVNGLEPLPGLEPVHLYHYCPTSFAHLHIYKSAHLKKVEDIGVEPMTPCVQGRCSSQLS